MTTLDRIEEIVDETRFIAIQRDWCETKKEAQGLINYTDNGLTINNHYLLYIDIEKFKKYKGLLAERLVDYIRNTPHPNNPIKYEIESRKYLDSKIIEILKLNFPKDKGLNVCFNHNFLDFKMHKISL